MALVENNVITHIADGDPDFFPDRINIDGKPWGIGWFTIDGNVTFNPPVVVQQFATSFLPEAFLAELTEDEFDLLDASNNATVKKFLRRLEGRKAGLVTVTPKYIADIGALLTDSILTQTRHDILVQGLPI